jgi:hypothetical protein
MIATQYGHLEVMMLLVNEGANKEKKDCVSVLPFQHQRLPMR